MFNFKQILSKNLITSCRRTFSQARVRNFFEVNPIFPDKSDPDRYLDVKKFNFADSDVQHDKQKEAFKSYAVHVATKRVLERNAARKSATQKIKTDNPKQRREEVLRNLAQSILVDPDLNLPYGFGFDDLIGQMKEKSLSTSNSAFLQGINELFQKLSYENDMELVELNREVIVQKSKGDFKEKARAIILDHVLKEINKQRTSKSANKRILRKLIKDEEFLNKTMENPEVNEEIVKEIQARIDPQRIENAAENLASDALTQRLKLNKEIRKKDKKDEDVERYLHMYTTKHIGSQNEDNYAEIEWMFPKDRGTEPLGMDEQAFRKFQVVDDVETKFTQARARFIDLNYQNDEKTFYDSENEEIEEPYTDSQLKKTILGDKVVGEYERKLGITSTKPKSFQEIFNEADKILENAPVFVKAYHVRDTKTGNTTFKPRVANLSINPDEFLWGNMSKLLDPVVPDNFKEELESVRDIIDGTGHQENRPMPKDLINPTRPEEEEDKEPEIEHLGEEGEHNESENKKLPIIDKSLKFDVSEVTPELEREIELFRHVRREPFFRHNLLNELRYYADRMNDQFASLYAGVAHMESRDNNLYNYDIPKIEIIKEAIRKEVNIESKIYNGKSYGSGKRKTSVALAIIQEGSGKISINRKSFVDYFGQLSMRRMIVQPLMVSGYSYSVDVNLFIWGGGVHAQSQAAQLALSRAIVNFNPGLKKTMRQSGFMIVDKRQTERKKIGLYKARAKYPYSRR